MEWQGLLKKLDAAVKSREQRGWISEIDGVKTVCSEKHRPLKAALTQLRGLLSKHQREIEKQSGKLISNAIGNVDSASELSSKNPAMNFLLKNVHGGQDLGCASALAAWSSPVLVILSVGDFPTDLMRQDSYKQYVKWFTERFDEKKQDKLVAAADIALSKAVASGLSAATEGSTALTDRKLFVKREQRAWSQSLFEVQHY